MRVKSLNENHLVISQSFSGVCVIVLALLSSALFQIVLRAEKMTIGLHLVSFAPFVFLFGIGLTMLRSLELKEDGIYHKWLGICYKKTNGNGSKILREHIRGGMVPLFSLQCRVPMFSRKRNTSMLSDIFRMDFRILSIISAGNT